MGLALWDSLSPPGKTKTRCNDLNPHFLQLVCAGQSIRIGALMADWTDPAAVLAATGVTVTTNQITQANGIIDIYSNITTAASANLTPRDRRLLASATNYQAAWMARQVDVFTRTEVESATQDGVSFSPAHEDALMLAPLAKRCLDRLSWRKPRSVRVIPTDQFGNPALNPIVATEAEFLRDGAGYGLSDYDWLPQ